MTDKSTHRHAEGIGLIVLVASLEACARDGGAQA
jgi:hypothetical protein